MGSKQGRRYGQALKEFKEGFRKARGKNLGINCQTNREAFWEECGKELMRTLGNLKERLRKAFHILALSND